MPPNCVHTVVPILWVECTPGAVGTGAGERTGAPLTIGRTFLTFYDFDTGIPRFEGALPSIEAMQMGPQALRLEAKNRVVEASLAGEVADGFFG